MDKLLKEVLMIDWLSIVETNKMIHTVETVIVKLVVEIESFGMSVDEFDKEIVSSDELQPKQADLSTKPIDEEIVKESDIKSLGNYIESKIKFVGKATSDITKVERVIDITPANQDMTKANSNLESMPGDNLESLSGFETKESDHDDDIHSVHKEELTKDDEKAADNMIDELVDMAKT
ncbi:hypothetical protein Tco_1561803 [Tanacetum coccineum]